ncbi:hypothetical protein AMC78_CH03188 [Rhizobium phaseoli]|nr:hypothetical protein AMC78_CH03188 [Rhizobium phaseoli]
MGGLAVISASMCATVSVDYALVVSLSVWSSVNGEIERVAVRDYKGYSYVARFA